MKKKKKLKIPISTSTEGIKIPAVGEKVEKSRWGGVKMYWGIPKNST